MSLTNDQITAQNFRDFYDGIRPYLNGQVPTFANSFSRSDILSTTEKIVGTDTDGMPIWQKTVIQAIPSGKVDEYSLYTFSDVTCSPVSVEWYTTKNDGKRLTGVRSDIVVDFYKQDSSTAAQLILTTNSDRTGFGSICATMKYTKVGDTPIKVGTGNDYSTDEQIVGSWIDGKPVYQKTITGRTSSSDDISTISNVFDGTNVPISITGIIYTYNSSNVFMPRPMYYYSSGDNFWAHMNPNINGFSVFNSGNRNRDFVLTVQYTKTV